jgi:hypothetical protein
MCVCKVRTAPQFTHPWSCLLCSMLIPCWLVPASDLVGRCVCYVWVVCMERVMGGMRTWCVCVWVRPCPRGKATSRLCGLRGVEMGLWRCAVGRAEPGALGKFSSSARIAYRFLAVWNGRAHSSHSSPARSDRIDAVAISPQRLCLCWLLCCGIFGGRTLFRDQLRGFSQQPPCRWHVEVFSHTTEACWMGLPLDTYVGTGHFSIRIGFDSL